MKFNSLISLIARENHMKFILDARSVREQPHNSQKLTFSSPDRGTPVGTCKNIGCHLFSSTASKHYIQFLHEEIRFKCWEDPGDAQLYP